MPKNSNKPWFNNVCNESKNNYNKFKKTLSKPLKDDEKEALKSLSKKHRKILRKEKRKFEEELNAKIRDLRSNDSGKYWNLIKPKKKARMGNISIDSAFTHLSDLNKAPSDSNGSAYENQNVVTNDIINCPFTVEEIKKSILTTSRKTNPLVLTIF